MSLLRRIFLVVPSLVEAGLLLIMSLNVSVVVKDAWVYEDTEGGGEDLHHAGEGDHNLILDGKEAHERNQDIVHFGFETVEHLHVGQSVKDILSLKHNLLVHL